MLTLKELIDDNEPAWNDVILDILNNATNHYEILPRNNKEKSENELIALQVTTRSTIGAIVYETGGILINYGWLRILGSGSQKLNRSIYEWNLGKSIHSKEEKPAFLLIADDILGGYFAINNGGLGNNIGSIYYFSQDRLEWENLNVGYTDFFTWTLQGNLDLFYQGFQWSDWKEDVQKLDGNQVFSFVPMLYTAEGKDIEKISKKAISIEENYNFTIGYK